MRLQIKQSDSLSYRLVGQVCQIISQNAAPTDSHCNFLKPDQAEQNVGPDLDLNF